MIDFSSGDLYVFSPQHRKTPGEHIGRTVFTFSSHFSFHSTFIIPLMSLNKRGAGLCCCCCAPSQTSCTSSTCFTVTFLEIITPALSSFRPFSKVSEVVKNTHLTLSLLSCSLFFWEIWVLTEAKEQTKIPTVVK